MGKFFLIRFTDGPFVPAGRSYGLKALGHRQHLARMKFMSRCYSKEGA